MTGIMENIIIDIRKRLLNSADEKTKTTAQGYFKEKINFYGVKTAVVTEISKEYFKRIEMKPTSEIFKLCGELWQSGFIEESFIACNWSYYVNKKYKPADFKVFEKWVKQYVNNWASCDTLCNHTIGSFIEMYPEYIAKLKEFALSENRWVRRAAAVTFIIPARKGKFLNDIFEIADTLLTDKDDLVQKGYGWMLKAASQANRNEVFDYVMSKKENMPRTALRYAIEKMPKELKEIAMKR